MPPRRKRTTYDASAPETIRALSDSVSRLTALVERLLGRGETTQGETTHPLPPLTARELEVARLIVEGLSTRQIAERLVVEPATVKTHRRGIARKLGASDRATLTAKRGEWDYP